MAFYLLHNYMDFIIVSAIIQVSVALLYSLIADTAMSGNIKKLSIVGIFAVFYLFLDSFSDFLPRTTKAKATQSIMAKMKIDLFDKIDKIDTHNLLDINKSEYTAILANDLNIIENEFWKPFLGLFLSLFTFVFSIIISMSLNLFLTILMILLSLFPLLAPYLSRKILGNKREKALYSQNKLFDYFNEFVSNFLTLKIGRGNKAYLHILKKSNEGLKRDKINFETTQAMTYAVSYGLGGIAYLGTWVFGGFFVSFGKITVPELIAMTTLMSTIAGPLQHLTSTFTEITSSKKIVDKFGEFIYSSKDEETIYLEDIDSEISEITLSDISISYENKRIISEFDYTFIKNKKYVITGYSGSGKSTLLKAIAGLIKPTNGSIKVQKKYLNNINRDQYYKKIAFVQQTTDVFNFSVCDNISVFNTYSLNDIIKILDRSGLKNTFEHNELESTQNDRILNLSGGELRRLEIARAMFKNADVILFDEPTSGLDKKNETIIKELIEEINNKIVIVVTHSTNDSFLTIFDEHISFN
ncbi:ATP-binding cassette domain-containing protein [Vagococcus acidifermentans]|uniref:ABC transporter ATP-binding protein n=2 Tax=Vagococcus acidifermentans TaxID=564710 RepID=A0A430AN03_9ENTE|nr:hypothetical protein CBF27_12845 [Vagococcus acidifermentans]